MLVALAGAGRAARASLLAAGSDVALSAVFRSGRPVQAVHGILIRALKVWREVANGKRIAGAQEVTWLMLKELGRAGGRRTRRAAKSIHLETLRENARGHALAIAAA